MNAQSPFNREDAPHDRLHGGETAPHDPAERSEGARRRTIVILALIAAVLLGAWLLYRRMGTDEVPAGAQDSQTPRVTVLAPGRGAVAGTITASGSIAARRDMPVGVVGEGGRVVSVPVEQGQWVNKGQVLASIDRSVQNQELAGQKAQIDVAQADANLAQSNLDRALKLVDRGFVSTADVDRLTSTRDAARARVQVAKAQYNQLQASNARLNILAPASGLLLQRSVEPGQTVSAGSQPLFRIAEGGQMELLAQVGEDDLTRLSVGENAQVSPVGSPKTFAGQIWQIQPTIDPTSRQGTVRIALGYDPALRPGGFATARINSGAVVAPILPESAIQSDDKGRYVYVIGNDNKVRRQAVQTGEVTPDGMTITKGLNGTERVVLRAGGFLNPGDTVQPVRASGSQAR